MLLTDNEKEIIFNCLRIIVREGSFEKGAVHAYRAIEERYGLLMHIPTYMYMSNYVPDDESMTYKMYLESLK